jgi:hypothetical protein
MTWYEIRVGLHSLNYITLLHFWWFKSNRKYYCSIFFEVYMVSFLLNLPYSHLIITCAHCQEHSHWVVCMCQTINFSPKNHNNSVHVRIYENTEIYMNYELKFFLPFHFSVLIDHIMKYSHSTTQMLQAFHGSFIHIWKWNMTTIFSCFSTKTFSRSNIYFQHYKAQFKG